MTNFKICPSLFSPKEQIFQNVHIVHSCDIWQSDQITLDHILAKRLFFQATSPKKQYPCCIWWTGPKFRRHGTRSQAKEGPDIQGDYLNL